MPLEDLLDNLTLQDPDEPIALFFSYVDADRYDYYRKNKTELVNLSSICRNRLIKYLEERRYTVVAEDNPLAAHPATIVISRSGIQTPFLEPKNAKDIAYLLINDINSSGFARPMSAVLGIRLQQLSAPVMHPQSSPGVFNYLRHPDGRIHDYIRYRYGKDFIDKMYTRAWESGEDITTLLKQEPHAENMSENLHSGRQLILEATASHARNNLEGRAIVFATLSYKNAARYAKHKGFIHHFRKAPGQVYYDDYIIEMGGRPEKDPKKQIETMIVPGKNAYAGVEIYMTTRRFQIPLEEELWSVFAEYNRAAYIPNTSELGQKRLNILWDAHCNGNRAQTYMPIGVKFENLLMERYLLRPNLELEDVLVTPTSKIRREYHDFVVNVERMKREVKDIKEADRDKPSVKDEHISIIEKTTNNQGKGR